MLKSVLIIFSSLILLGCSNSYLKIGDEKWPLPSKPETLPVHIQPISQTKTNSDGFYMSFEDADNLSKNIIELKAYIEKLELLIREIETYYNKEK